MDNKLTHAPVVAVLGHVDHGKTTLLDSFRKSSVATGETGGITQKIGASVIHIKHEGKDRKITLIDTPGHEAFANMRSRGVSAADILLLIVASDDGVMPQTKESIQKIQESKLPFIVVFTKSDLETAQPEKVKQMLMKEGIMLEGLGGDTPYISVSSKTGENIQELLDLVILSYDLAGIEKKETEPFMGVVIDSKLDQRRGVVCSIVVKQGILKVTDKVYLELEEVGKVKALIPPEGGMVKTALPGDAAEILGVTKVLPAGSVLTTTPQELHPVVVQEAVSVRATSALALFADADTDFLPIVLKTDSSGEIEAIKEYLPEKVKVSYEGQGEIGIADILMAKDFKAIVIGFNVGITKEAERLAQADNIFFKSYKIIYELLDELNELQEALLNKPQERFIGKALIQARFEGTSGIIIGIKVQEGRIASRDRVVIMRGEKEIGTSHITTMKRGKEDIKEAGKNTEAGIQISPELDFVVGDMILSRSTKR